ncbi:MAG: HAMP domain-containing histidine kinase [Chloroflexaceae bacterium]|nr:HAMP domain-containing histidine kinase [Chloroflexaceae bacterium]
MTLTKELFSLYDAIDETLGRLRASAEGYRIILRQDIPPGLPWLEADRDKVVRVLQNLLDNAIKYSPMGGEIVIGTARVSINPYRGFGPPPPLPVTLPELTGGEWQVFWVRDQGPGIPPQYQERIFEKFGQIRGRKVRGTGLGLTFCKLAVESHGGRIWVESIEGEGSTFALALPR